MDVIFCYNSSEANIINKNITEVKTKTCIIKGNISHETPTVIVDYDGDINLVNYMKITELGRCYYITDIVNLTGSRYEIRGKVDVLESFKTAILELSAIIDKQNAASQTNMYLDDGSFITENKEFNTAINFPSGFNADGEYILITAGGGGGII